MAPNRLQLAEGEIPQFALYPLNVPKEEIFSRVVFKHVPCPLCVRGKEFTDDIRIGIALLRVQRRKLFLQCLGE